MHVSRGAALLWCRRTEDRSRHIAYIPIHEFVSASCWGVGGCVRIRWDFVKYVLSLADVHCSLAGDSTKEVVAWAMKETVLFENWIKVTLIQCNCLFLPVVGMHGNPSSVQEGRACTMLNTCASRF